MKIISALRQLIVRSLRQFAGRKKMVGKNPDETELREMLMRYRLLKEETSDPIATRFLHDIVVGLEAELDHLQSPSRKSFRG
jgi:hypothetical protein